MKFLVYPSLPQSTAACLEHAGRHHTRLSRQSVPAARNARQKPALETPASQQRHPFRCNAAASISPQTSSSPTDVLVRWLIEQRGLQPQRAEVTCTDDGACTLTANQDTQAGQALMELPGDISVTTVDVSAHAEAAPLAAGRGELTGLALWLMAERQKGVRSEWAPFLASLPSATLSPVLWDERQQAELLRGSPVLAEAARRRAELQREWASVAEAVAADPSRYSPDRYNFEGFAAAMSVVLAHAAYLPSASCFALLPLVTLAPKTGNQARGAVLDYDLQREVVTLTAVSSVRQGEAVRVFDGRPNGELVLATGTLEDGNPADCQTVQVGLVQADRLYTTKKQVVESVGLSAVQAFPVFQDRMPVQLLAYLRLARLTDTALLAKVSLEEDVVLSQTNEYEVLQLLLGECRDRLTSYAGTAEEDTKILQRRDLSPQERLAARLRLAEKRILQSTLDAVRRRLAPIRGIPTKSGGMSDPNADLREVFDTIEALPSLPSKLVGGLMSWARGEQDPDWKKGGPDAKKKSLPKQPPR